MHALYSISSLQTPAALLACECGYTRIGVWLYLYIGVAKLTEGCGYAYIEV